MTYAVLHYAHLAESASGHETALVSSSQLPVSLETDGGEVAMSFSKCIWRRAEATNMRVSKPYLSPPLLLSCLSSGFL